jgi:hypothetical protein
MKITSLAKGLGWASVGFGTILDGIGVYKYYHNGANTEGAVNPVHATVNFGVGAIGMSSGPPGWIISTIYFGIGATIGWDKQELHSDGR